MTSTPKSSQPTITQPVAQRETAALEPSSAVLTDPASALDHRSRRRAMRPEDAAPGHYLAFETEAGERLLIAVEDRVTHLGRAATADLRFEDPRVSRRHAILVRYGQQVRALDDRSSGGTYVNGVRISATDLSDGDVIRIGPVAFTYVTVA